MAAHTLSLVCVLAITLAGCAGTPNPVDAPVVQYPQKQVFDLFEAALRYRLAQTPVDRRHACYVELGENIDVPAGSVHSFAKRFPGYRMVMGQGSPGNSPPSPWFYLHLGRTTQDHAWISIDGQSGELLYTLVRQDDRWVVVEAKPIIII